MLNTKQIYKETITKSWRFFPIRNCHREMFLKIRILHLYLKSLQSTLVKEFFFNKVPSFRHATLLKIKLFAGISKDFNLKWRGTAFQKSFGKTSLDGWFLLLHDFLEFTSVFDTFLPCKIFFHVSSRSHRRL